MEIYLLTFYGVFLFCSAIAAFIFIGPKAKTALISGGMSGSVSLIIAYCLTENIKGSALAGLILCLVLFTVFAWRSTKTFLTLLEMLNQTSEDIRGKAIAFLIISLMAVISLTFAGILFALMGN